MLVQRQTPKLLSHCVILKKYLTNYNALYTRHYNDLSVDYAQNTQKVPLRFDRLLLLTRSNLAVYQIATCNAPSNRLKATIAEPVRSVHFN